MSEPVRIWYVAGQRLCNFSCPYCVSVGTWTKSGDREWMEPADREKFAAIVEWIGSQEYEVAVRLGSLGEPFASRDFLDRAAWLTRRPQVRFVELVSNGSLLARRLPVLMDTADLGKLSLWLTWHASEISLDRFLAGARAAQEEYGCFVVVNALLFPDNTEPVRSLTTAATAAGLRCNLDLGYDPQVPAHAHRHDPDLARAVPALGLRDIEGTITTLGGDPALTRVALTGLTSPTGRACRAGHDYVFIAIDGQVFRCSRYCALGRETAGNVLDPGFRLAPQPQTWAPCAAPDGCANKEDFLNLADAEQLRPDGVPSLGWTGR